MRNYTAFLAALAIFAVTNLTWYFIISAKYTTPHPYIGGPSQYPLQVADVSRLPELSPRPDSIFFVETSGKSRLDLKEICSIESAAKNNADKNVYVVMTSPTMEFHNHSTASAVVKGYPNLHFRHVDAHTFVSDSELRGLWEEGIIQRSKFFVSHFSDVMRFLLLHKFGGTYLDMDQIVLKSLPDLPNFLGRESIWIGKKTLRFCVTSSSVTSNITAAGVMRFQHGHPILQEFLREMSAKFDGDDWGSNGPMLVSRVLMRLCGVSSVDDLKPERCLGVAALPTVNFYPVPWRSWRRLFDPKLTEEVLKEVEESYCVHIWGRHSKSAQFPKAGTENAYAALASRHCPVTFREGRCLQSLER